jgi:AcrR family transcriptional regulator
VRAVNGDSAGQSTKRRIEEAALHLFAAKGFEATGIRDIADRVGISTAALYHYMGSKDELLVDFMLVSMTQLTRAAREALATADEPASELAALVRTHVGFHTLDPLRSLVADDELRSLSEEALARVMVLRDSYEALWADLLERGLADGVFHICDARIARLALLEMCNGIVRWYSDAGPMGPAEVADAFTDLALAMVGTRCQGRALKLGDLRCAPTSEVLQIVERVLREVDDVAVRPPAVGAAAVRPAASAGVA